MMTDGAQAVCVYARVTAIALLTADGGGVEVDAVLTPVGKMAGGAKGKRDNTKCQM